MASTYATALFHSVFFQNTTFPSVTISCSGNAFQLDTRDYDNVQDYMRDLNGINTGMADEDQPVLQAASAAQGL